MATNVAAFAAALRDVRRTVSHDDVPPRAVAHVDLALMIVEDQLRLSRTGRTSGLWTSRETDTLIADALTALEAAQAELSSATDLHRVLTLLLVHLDRGQ